MLSDKTISIHLSCQQFECDSFTFDPKKTQNRIEFRSTRDTSEVRCPHCKGKVHVYDSNTTTLRDMPLIYGSRLILNVSYHRYRCLSCERTFSENIPMRYRTSRITERAAQWVRGLLLWHLPIKAVQEITGINWETIRDIHRSMMDAALEARRMELKDKDYKPVFLAVDEFAIHKGHSYATCVMDLVQGDVIWVGEGRSKDCFMRFFEETDMDYLSQVKAFAMDMNASYNVLVERYLPHAEIVYDRYHMQAQFGRDVLGVVRLSEARAHKAEAERIGKEASLENDQERRKELRSQVKDEMRKYSELKGSRWKVLADSSNLSEPGRRSLESILGSHEDLALCYAMKEEMCALFELEDPDAARAGWIKWFEAAKASGIESLVKFAKLKEKRLEGLVAHARYNISTGKLEGFNNRIKVAKRIGYGYRDDDYFFTLIRYMSIPNLRESSHRIS